jgi:hypothetical protein
MRLLGGMLITKMQVAAMERVNVPEETREDFYLYVDEFQNFAVESFAGILSEARKYRLNLIMAHQYITQLSEEVRDAVFGNVGTMITFRVGSPDAVFMENEFMPRFTPEDIINLPKAGIYLKLMIDGVASQPFSAITLPPIAQRTGSLPRVVEQSRERYAGNRAMIEERVAVWSGFGAGVDVEKMIAGVTQAKKDAKKARFSHEYTCTRCGKIFTLPVELDKSRPIYCEDCKPIVDAERAKSKERGVQKTKMSDGEVIVKKTEGSVSLAQLAPKPVAVPVPVEATHVHELVPKTVAVVAPAPAPAPLPVVAPALRPITPITPSTPTGVGQEAAKKRKRVRKRKPYPGNSPAVVAPRLESPAIPRPQPPTAQATPTIVEPTPTPVLPGERISFDT